MVIPFKFLPSLYHKDLFGQIFQILLSVVKLILEWTLLCKFLKNCIFKKIQTILLTVVAKEIIMYKKLKGEFYEDF